MTLRTTTDSAGTNGVAYTASTLGVNTFYGTGVFTATNTNLLPGTTLNWVVNESTNTIIAALTGTTDSSGAVAVYVYFFALPGTANNIFDVRSASASAARFGISAGNHFTVINAAGSVINSFASTVAINTWYRLELSAVEGTTTSNGTINGAYYLGSSTTPQDTVYNSGAVVNAGTAAITEYRVGKLTATNAVNAQFAAFSANNGTSAFVGPTVSASSGNVAAVAAQVSVAATPPSVSVASNISGTVGMVTVSATAPTVTAANNGSSGNAFLSLSASGNVVVNPSLMQSQAVANVEGVTATKYTGGGPTLAFVIDTNNPHQGTSSLQVTTSGSADYPYIYPVNINGDGAALINPSTVYTAQIWVRPTTGFSRGHAQISFFGNNSNFQSSASGPATNLTAGVWTQLTATGTSGSLADYAVAQFSADNSEAVGAQINIDQFDIFLGSSAPTTAAGSGSISLSSSGIPTTTQATSGIASISLGASGQGPTTGGASLTLSATGYTSLSPITKSGTKLQVNGVTTRFSGANVYWLGLSDNEGGSPGTFPTQSQITAALSGVKTMGANLIRAHTVGISAGTSMSYLTGYSGTTPTYSESNMASADWAVYQAGLKGIYMMIPLTDNWNYYHYGLWWFVHQAYIQNPSGITDVNGSIKDDTNNRQFFANTAGGLRIRALYKAYISQWLNHVNQFTGIAYKNDPTIAILETGNEIYYSAQIDPGVGEWTQDIASYIKSIAPNKLVADGAAASGQAVSGMAGLVAASVDIVGGHYYPQDPTNSYNPTTFAASGGSSSFGGNSALTQLSADVTAAAGANRVYINGEYPWTRSDVASWYSAINGNTNISGDMFWSFIGNTTGGVPDTHGGAFGSDDYAVHYPYSGTNETTYAPALATHIQNSSSVLAISGNAVITLGASGTGGGNTGGSGTANITLSASGADKAVSAGSASIILGASAIASSASPAGSASITLTGSGTEGAVASSGGSISLSGAATPASRGAGAGSISLGATGASAPQSAGSAAITLSASSNTATTSSGAASISFTGSMATSMVFAAVGSASISLGASGNSGTLFVADSSYPGTYQFAGAQDPSYPGTYSASSVGVQQDGAYPGTYNVSNFGVISAVATGSASISLFGSGSSASKASGSASIGLSGSSTAKAPISGSGNISLSASALTSSASSGTASILMSGSSAQISIAAVGAGSISLFGTAGSVIAAIGAGSIVLSGSAATSSAAFGAGSISLSSSGSQIARSSGSASITISGTMSSNGSIPAVGSGSISLSGSSSSSTSGVGSANLSISGSSSAFVSATSSAVISLSGSGSGGIANSATANIVLGGAGSSGSAVFGSGSITISGSLTAQNNFTLWTGSIEIPIYLQGVWNGSTIVPASVSLVT